MRVLIVENTAITHHGQLGVALHERAAKIDILRPFRGDSLPLSPVSDALVVFGGEQNALDDANHPYLAELGALMVSYSKADLPVLGICLGAQILARGFGGENKIGVTREFGWHQVALSDAGRQDPVLGHLPEEFPIFQWHSDSFALPQGAVHLAQSKLAQNQAFRIGAKTYGMQFHFEANRAVAADWNRLFPALSEEMHPGWAEERPKRAETMGRAADAHGLAIARAWVDLIDPAPQP